MAVSANGLFGLKGVMGTGVLAASALTESGIGAG